MTAQVVQVTFVDLATKQTVYPGLTATLYNNWTSILIDLEGDNTFSSANVTISDHPKSNKDNFKPITIKKGENKIVKGAAGGDKTYPFEDGKKYSIKIVAYKTDDTSYVGRFSWGGTSHSNKKVFPFVFQDSTRLAYLDTPEILEHELVEDGEDVKLRCLIITPRLPYLQTQKDARLLELSSLSTLSMLISELESLNNQLDQLTQGTQEHTDKLAEIDAKQAEITVKEAQLTAKQAEITAIEEEIDYYNNISTPSVVTFAFEEADDYPGNVNDSDNAEDTAAYVSLAYREDGVYTIPANKLTTLENDRAYNVAVSVKFTDGNAISKPLNDNMHVIANPVISVDPYGLGDDNTGADDLATASVAVLYVEKETIGLSGSRIPANDAFRVNFSQGTTIMYTGTLKVIEGTETTRDEKTVLMYDIKRNQLTKPGTPGANSDGTFAFDAQIIVDYTTLSGTSVSTLPKPSNTVSGTYVNDYTQLTNVYVANAWMAATNVDVSGNRVVNMTDATTASGYTDAPDIGIVGYFYKTAHFGSGETGLLQDLDVVGTKFKYEITDASDNWVPVTKIRQIQGGDAPTTAQQNYINVNNFNGLQSGGGVASNEYANIPYSNSNSTVTSGPSQPPIYFRISEPTVSKGQNVKVRVTIVPAGKTTNVGSKESDTVVVVKKINRYTMLLDSPSEPKFTGSGANGILAIPINAEGSGADSTFVSARFESNLAGANADITQTDDSVNPDNVYDLIVTNPSKRGENASEKAITYTVTYKINDPTTTTAGTVSIKSVNNIINVSDEPTNENFTVSNYSYKTFNDHGESSFKFDVQFRDGTATGIDGVNVYFYNSDVSSTKLLVSNVARVDRTNNFTYTNQLVRLQDSAGGAATSATSDGILIDLPLGTNSSNKWLNYKSGTISFVPYKTPRVSSVNNGNNNTYVKIESNTAYNKDILNVPVIDMPKNVLLVGGVVESYSGTQLTWSDDSGNYPDATSAVVPSYDVEVNGVNKSDDVVPDSADASKLSYSVDTDSNPAPYNFTIVLRTKLASKGDSTAVYYSKPVTVEFTSVSVDLSNATAVVRRGSNATTLKAQLNGYEITDATPSNLNVTEFKLVDASGENVCIAMQDGVETVLTDAQIGTTQGGIISDSSRSIITHDANVDGWSIKNTYADGATTSPYVNLYYYKNVIAEAAVQPKGDYLDASNSFTLSQATGLGLYAVFNQNQGAKFYPSFYVFTAKTTSGSNKSWYKSKVVYYPVDDHEKADTTADSDNAGLTFVYTGTDDGSLFPEITKRVKYVVRYGPDLTNANESYESERVWLISFYTSKNLVSNSSEGYNFRVLETGMFVDGDKLNVRYNVVSDPESAAVNVLTHSTDTAVQEAGTVPATIHTYVLSADYQKSDILQLHARMEAGVDYTVKSGDAAPTDNESEPTYLSLVSSAKVRYTCASKPSVEVVGTRGTSALYNNRKVINLKINANGLEREGVQSVIISLLKEGDHTVDGASEGSEIVLSFESSNGRLRSYLVEEDGATVTTTGSLDNLGRFESHELLDDNDVTGFSGTTLSNTNTFLLEMGTLDDNDASKLHLPAGSEWDNGEVTVLAVVSTRIGTDIDYDTVEDIETP